ncbi:MULTISPECIES: hypothetical protein [Shewanella]|nr:MULTISPECIES: hypothetical protein [Shewanella]KPZ71540.1 hypothetical protein AN944_01552 [Shewanella sp. P1-14-1]MBQ4891662.1 hypothetical protein [Shewanella sp. MMG014]
MKKSHYQKLRNERSKRLNNEETPRETNPKMIVAVIVLLAILAFLLV